MQTLLGIMGQEKARNDSSQVEGEVRDLEKDERTMLRKSTSEGCLSPFFTGSPEATM